MTGDAIFIQGHTHDVCQDYAIASIDSLAKKHAAAIVCDGCSSSAKSEVGAAMLPHIFLASYLDLRFGHLKHEPLLEKTFSFLLRESIVERVKEVMRHANLSDNAFDATVVAAIADPDRDVLRLFMWGDGHILVNSEEGQFLYSGQYSSGAPKYLSYSLDPMRSEMYYRAFGENGSITTKAVLPNGTQERITTDLPDYHSFVIPLTGVSMVQVFSDGLDSFVTKDSKPVLVSDILPAVAKFKLTHGCFVQRRVRRALRDFEKDGITHYDDFSSAAISFEDSTLVRGK